ncbi:exported protein of unknown function [Candidatus Promineifilum breve]|uniref:Uncharacterized protein n=1 Tax=Candidatus Promineifilum breve TaxID=1806508 RepID=A0A160TAU5_9CHLR|nr:hypothetical protein [Candidatus Promineifilum breve]CUS06240.1 exported protein of unknown function [Candidatus Promineifilum breve]
MLANKPKLVLQLILISAFLLVFAAGCEPDVLGLFVSMSDEGTTEDGVVYDENDILFLDEESDPAFWSTVFDGEAYGLNDEKHAIGAFSFNETIFYNPDAAVNEPGEMELYLSFQANRAWVPGISDRVQGQDIVHFYTPDGIEYNYDLIFDGSDVDLTNGTEKIDGFSFWPPEYYDLFVPDVDLPYDCSAGVIFISTRGSYRVSADHLPNGHLKGNGSDLLAFCATNLGWDTAGFWFRVFESSQAEIFPRSVITAVDVFALDPNWVNAGGPDGGNLDVDLYFFFAVRNAFTSNGGSGGPSQLFVGGVEDGNYGTVGPIIDFNDSDLPALNGTITAMSMLDFIGPDAP